MTNPVDRMTGNELINERQRIKDELSDLNRRVKDLKGEQEAVDIAIMVKLDGEGTTRMANGNASVSITETTVAEVVDWDQVYDYIIDSKDFSLLQRRISTPAFQELLQMNPAIPGLAPRTVRRVNFTKAQ